MKIPDKIKEFIDAQGIFAVGTIGGTEIANVSPRIFFKIEDDAIYWLDFFKHKSYRNYQTNSWVTVSVFNKEDLEGYQIRGKVSFITDEPTKSDIRKFIVKNILKANISSKIKSLSEKDAVVVQFEPRVYYSLNPEDTSYLSIGSDIDANSFFQK
jgi:hypothetical protein